jgi:copper chaperone CopZ
MKQLMFLLLFAMAFQACQGDAGRNRESSGNNSPAIVVAPENMGAISFDVEGMTCTGCEAAVERSVKSLEGIIEVKASHETGKTTVRYDTSRIGEGELKAGIESAGYGVKGSGRIE